MIFFIIGVLAALVALAVLLLSEEGKAAAFIPGVVAVILIGVSCVSYVPTGYTGIVTTFGKVEDGTKDAGVVFKSPWQSIVKMDNRVQEMNMDLSAFSSDIQEVATSVAVGYRINQQNAMTIYKSVGKKYEDTLITPRVQETVKAVVAHYDASSLISNRDAVASQMDTKLREVLAEYNIDLQYISVTNFDFTDTFTDAVEAKVKAQQEKEKAETDAEKRRVEAQATADADLIAANLDHFRREQLFPLKVQPFAVGHDGIRAGLFLRKAAFPISPVAFVVAGLDDLGDPLDAFGGALPGGIQHLFGGAGRGPAGHGESVDLDVGNIHNNKFVLLFVGGHGIISFSFS